MSKYLHLLLAGHNGTFSFKGETHYLNAGKQSPEVPPGIYEGQFNRAICRNIGRYAENTGFDLEFLNTGPYNIPQSERVDLVNSIHAKVGGKCILHVIHANAARGAGWSSSRGSAVFHSRNASVRSKVLAKMFSKGLDEGTLLMSRGVKVAGHTITTKTKCPAALIEGGFMTNRFDAEYMASEMGQQDISESIWNTIVEFDSTY